ncbi:trace amine-associated receptor 4-like protein [Labeo rohita]|uniref:Trace amine-associated receptor 4-like protein n=1 Tax=Labeo rohita TaxID=84645 RepID=A0A498NK41_LABRO|nr:trace amine-associated receptor 4-like protein [Labeo rohita]
MFLCYPLLPNSCQKLQRLIVVKVVMYVFLVLMILTTVFGNLLIIISISHFKQLQSPTHLIVRSLAASDCLLGSFVMPYSMVRSVEGCWYLGAVVCKVHSSLDMTFCISSVLHLGLISVDSFFMTTKKIFLASRANVMTFNETDIYFENMFLCYPLLPNSCQKLQRLIVVKVVMYVLMVLMILTTVFGNLLIIISISHFKQLQSPTHLIVRSLAASDCLLGSFVMPYSMKIISASGSYMMTSNETQTENMFLCYPLRLDSCLKLHRLTVVKVAMYVFMVLMILTTVFGNLLIIISISHFKQLQSPTHLIVRSLAASDCLLGSLVMPQSMVRSVEGCWYLGDFVCNVHSSLDMTFCISSILHLSLISVDRDKCSWT